MGTFHEVLPGNLVFFHFYYIRTKELEYLDQTTQLYWKNYISTENFKSGIQNLSQLFRDQAVSREMRKLFCCLDNRYFLEVGMVARARTASRDALPKKEGASISAVKLPLIKPNLFSKDATN